MRKVDRHGALQRFIDGRIAAFRRQFRPRPMTPPAPPPPRMVATHGDAMIKLVDPAATRKSRVRNRQDAVDYSVIHPELIEFYQALIKELRKKNIPFVPADFYRSAAKQMEAFKRGYSNAKPGQSPHQWGCAFDLIHWSRAWDVTRKEWDVIGAIGKEVARRKKIKITWGGDFRSIYDPAHWELTDWRNIRTAANYALEHDIAVPAKGEERFTRLEKIYQDRIKN